MSNQYFNFYYDPVRQGYDTNTWSASFGVPTVVNNKLQLTSADVIHFADLLRGDATFNVTMSVPTAGDISNIGFISFTKNAYALFEVVDDVFSAITSDGVNTKSVVIDWNVDWSDTATEYRIKWEAGMITFYVGGQFKAQIEDISVTGDPMSLYCSSDASGPMKIGYINVKGVQSSTLKVM